jgi:hypothetical protein
MPLDDYRILLDVPAQTANFGFESYAQALTELIVQSQPQFAIGLFGAWGSGKTTLMHAIRRRLSANPAIIVADFSAWRYEREPNLIVPLLDTISEALEAWQQTADPDGAQKAGNAASNVRRVIRSLIAGSSLSVGKEGVLQATLDGGKALEAYREPGKDPPDAGRSVYHLAFRKLAVAFDGFLDKAGRRVVVFVDDLDRCLPQGALEVMESIKLFFDLPGFIFVVGLDNEVVQACVELKYKEFDNDTRKGRVRGAEYIKKIFQVPFQLPPARVTDLDAFLASAVSDARMPQAQSSELLNVVRPHFDYLAGDGGLNPRDIKRYINAYTIARKVDPGLQQDALLAAQALSSRSDWERLNTALLAYGEAFIDAVKQATAPGGNPAAVGDLDDALEVLPASFRDYVSVGRPGVALLDQGAEIRRYILSAARGSVGQITLEAIKQLGIVRNLLRLEMDDSSAGSNKSAIVQAVDSAQSYLSTTGTASGATIIQDVNTIAQKCQALPSGPDASDAARETRRAATTELRKLIEDLMRRLAQLTTSASPT